MLDDPLSAVDEETAAAIFENAICSRNSPASAEETEKDTAVLAGKTRLLVMNSHLHLLASGW